MFYVIMKAKLAHIFVCIMPWTYSVSVVRTFIRYYVCRYVVRSVCPYVRDLFYSG